MPRQQCCREMYTVSLRHSSYHLSNYSSTLKTHSHFSIYAFGETPNCCLRTGNQHREETLELWNWYLCLDSTLACRHIGRYWPFVRGIHRPPVNSPHKGQWRGALTISLICAWTNGWTSNRDANDLRRLHAYYDVTVMGMICAGIAGPNKHTLATLLCCVIIVGKL